MKKIVSISLIFLMLTAMIRFSVATHYCHGVVAASKISLSGSLASCGMENDNNESNSTGDNVKSLCCDDIVTYISIDNNYTPSSPFVQVVHNYDIQFLNITHSTDVLTSEPTKSIYTNGSPPWLWISTSVDLADICIFRI